jgi:hypothetical protein
MDPGQADILRRVGAQAKAQEQLVAVLQSTIQQPHTIRRVNVNMAAVIAEGDQRVLVIATPGGERIDIPLSEVACAELSRALSALRQN